MWNLIWGDHNHTLIQLMNFVLKITNIYIVRTYEGTLDNNIVTNSQVLFHDGSLLHSQLNTQPLITVHNSSRILTHV
jgi:hypothetical protein